MRRLTRISFSALALLLTAVSCDSTQPLQTTTQSALIFLTADANMELWDVYDVLVDTSSPPDDEPDVQDPRTECRPARDSSGKPVLGPRKVPWRVSGDISVLRGGTTTPERIASSHDVSFNEKFASLLEYDAQVSEAPAAAPNPPFFFVNGQRISQATRRWLEKCADPPQSPLPNPNLLGGPLPFPVTLGKGDTLIVQARKQLDRNAGTTVPSFPVASQPVLSVSVVVNGQAVTLQGTISSTVASGDGVSISYTVR